MPKEKMTLKEFFYRLRDILHIVEVDSKEMDYIVDNVKNLIKEFEELCYQYKGGKSYVKTNNRNKK